MPIWADYFKLFTYAFAKDPLARKIDIRDLTGAGISQPDAIPSMGPDGSFWGGNEQRLVRYRETQDFIDLSTVSNRMSRYKEYERLRNVAEIEMAMTVFADEACIAGHTKIATPFGFPTIEHLAKQKPDERFLVYCWDFEKEDYTLGWAFAPRFVKKSSTVRVMLDDGTDFIVTPDHRVLRKNQKWVPAGNLKFGDELMPFYRLKANQSLTKVRSQQFPRIYTHNKGWIHERQFVDEWRSGKDDRYARVNKIVQAVVGGMVMDDIVDYIGHDWKTFKSSLKCEGFSLSEVKQLAKKKDRRRVVGVVPDKEIDVYDMSVEQHQNFCSESVVFHNCQKYEKNHVFKIECNNHQVKEELEFLFYHRMMLNMDRRIWSDFKNLCIFGDLFYEIVINPEEPKDGVMKITRLPPESIYRIETTKGKVVEFQQSKEGPDYQSLIRAPVVQATDSEIQQATAIRFTPEQIIHIRIGDDRKTFYPYGVSLVEAARGPAHQLRLMEDAMVVYRLTRAPERRVFYIDVGQLPPFKAEAFIERMKDQFRKKKVASNRGGPFGGASNVEERWHAPAADEDYWLPIRPNSQTKIDTLPGAQNLGEIDDAVYFRNKLFSALNFPRNYFNNEDPNTTRITLSAQDIKFARMIERLQSHMEDGLWEIADRHLRLMGFPEETYDDLRIKMTPPSDWRELSRAEVTTNRITNASSLKSGQLMADYDIHTRWMKYSEDETEEILARLKIQKLEDLKLQVLAQNPQLLGVGIPGQTPQPGQEMGAEPGGPNPMLGPDAGGMGGPPGGAPGAPPGGAPPPGGMPGMPSMAAEVEPQGPQPPGPSGSPGPASPEGAPLPEPDDEDILKYDLEIQDYEAEQDVEDIDHSADED